MSMVKRLAVAVGVSLLSGGAWAQSAPVISLDERQPSVTEVENALFPKDLEECEELKKAGFKCASIIVLPRFSLGAVQFDVGSSELSDTAKRALDPFASVLKARAKARGAQILIEGHTDVTGTDALNQRLSEDRAASVRDYLISRGAPENMLVTLGKGSQELRKPDDPTSAENRRVEIGRKRPKD